MISVPITDPKLLAHLDGLAPDGISLFTLGSPEGPVGGELRGALVHATRLVNRMRANHGLGLFETYVLGQACIAGALIASTLKDEDRISISLDCEGPIHGWSVEARARGDRAGYATRGHLFREIIPLTQAP